MRWYGWATAVILLVAVAGVPTAGAEVPTLIVPGQALGPVQLGMSVAEVTAVLGQPVPESPGRLAFPRWRVTATFREGRAVRLSTTDPRFVTHRGARVGIRFEEATPLVRDRNEVRTLSGSELIVSYPFQGLGFVFRDGRAVEVFVEPPIALGPQPAAPLEGPSQPGETLEMPGLLPPVPPLPPPAGTSPARAPESAPSSQGAPLPGVRLEVRALEEAVDAANSVFGVTGKIANTGVQPVGSVIVSAAFVKTGEAGGEETQTQVVLEQPIAPGGEVPFALQTSLSRSLVIRYTVGLTVGGARVSPGPREEQRTVSPAAYADLARRRVKVDVQLGAPSSTARAPMVQVLVSIGSTTPLPREWVREVQVEVPYTGGSRSLTLAPGQVQTILVPSVAQVGQPQILGVRLSVP